MMTKRNLWVSLFLFLFAMNMWWGCEKDPPTSSKKQPPPILGREVFLGAVNDFKESEYGGVVDPVERTTLYAWIDSLAAVAGDTSMAAFIPKDKAVTDTGAFETWCKEYLDDKGYSVSWVKPIRVQILGNEPKVIKYLVFIKPKEAKSDGK